MTTDALTVTHPQRQSETSMKFLILTCCAVIAAAKPHVYLYDGMVGMPIDMNGRVVVSQEVARANAAHLTSDRYIDEKPKIVNMTPLMATQRQRVPAFIASYSSQGYDGRQSPINQYNQLVQAAELAILRAQYLTALAQSQAKGAGTTYSGASSLPTGYSYRAQAAQHSQAQYVNLAVPIGEQDTSSPHHVHPQGSTFANDQISSSPSFNGYSYEAQAAQQEQGFVVTKPEAVKSDCNVHSPNNDLYMSSLPQPKPEGANFVATSSSSPSSEGYSYGAPAIQQTQENPITKPITNEPNYNNLPAPVGEHATFLPQSEPEGANFVATSSPLPSFEGYSYGAPAIQQTQENPVTKPITNEPHYTNLPAPIGEHATFLPQSSSSPSSEGYSYGAPAIQQTQKNPVTKPITNEPNYNNLPAPVGEHATFLPQSEPEGANFVATSSPLPSFEGYSYGAPAIQQTQENPVIKPITNEPHYTNLPAPIGEHATFLPQSSSSPSSEGYSYGAPAIQQTQENPVTKPITNEPQYTNHPAPIGEHATFLPQSEPQGANFATPSSSLEGYSYVATVTHPTENFMPIKVVIAQSGPPAPAYTGPLAPIGEDGRVIDTEEVAKLKSEHLATLAQANAEALALAAKSNSSTTYEEYAYEEPAIQQTQGFASTKPVASAPQYTNQAKPQGANFVPTSSSSPSSEGYSYEVPAIQQTQENLVIKPITNEPDYTNLPAPIGEHATFLPQSEPQGANFVPTSSSSSSSEGYSYGAPAIQQTQENPVIKPITNEPNYTNLPAPIGGHATFLPQSSSSPSFEGYSYGVPAIQQTQENPVIKPILPAPVSEHATFVSQSEPQGANFVPTSSSSPSSEGYSYGAPAIQQTQENPVIKPITNEPNYTNLPAPIGEHATFLPQSSSSPSFEGYSYGAPAIQQTQENPVIKPILPAPVSEHATFLSQSEPQGANFVPTSSSSPSSEGYSYGVPAIQQTQENPVIKPILPAPVSEHATFVSQSEPQGANFVPTSSSSPSSEGYSYGAPAIQQTQENPVIKPITNEPNYTNLPAPIGEHATFLPQSSSSPSFEGYSYGAPAIQQIQENPVTKPITNEPHYTNLSAPIVEHATFLPQYTGPLAPIGEDGRVIDTEEVAKLKSEHLATLAQANAEALALAAKSNSSTTLEEYAYEEPAIQQTQKNSIPKPVVMQPQYTNLPAAIGEQANSFVHQAKPQGDNFAASLNPSEGYSYAIDQPHYTGPQAPIGEDGRVIDTEEVARAKNNHLAILAQANAHQASTTAQSAASSSSATETTGDTNLSIQRNNSGHQQQTFAIAGSPDIVKAQQTYASPVQQQSYDQEIIGSDEVAQSKIQHVAQINQKAETSGATALSSPSSSSSFASSSEQLTHPKKLNQEFVPPAPIEKPQGYYGNATQISSESKFRNFNTPTTFGAIAHEPTKIFNGAEVTIKPAGLPVNRIRPMSTIVPLVPQTRPLNGGARRRFVQRVIRRRPIYDGPLAPLDSAGHVIDTEEVAALKAERLATLDQANSRAIKLANAVKASKPTDNLPITYQSLKN